MQQINNYLLSSGQFIIIINARYCVSILNHQSRIMKSIEQVENLVRFALTSGVGSITVNRLLRHFGNSSAILSAGEKELLEVKGLRKPQIAAVLEAAETNPRLELEMAEEAGVKIIAYDDPSFPQQLLECNDPPYILYVKGELQPEDAAAVGIVGTRAASRYGCEQAERFGAGLSVSGYTVVSGLARGIDTFAHRGALSARGRTIGVIGCGLNHVYPPENRDLYTEIPLSGAIISEFTMDTSPGKDTFPRRNRIIAGLSLGVLVIEAPERSGALITSRQAMEMGREVFALPGRVDQENNSGSHKLIREGATLVCQPSDIIDELPKPEIKHHTPQTPVRAVSAPAEKTNKPSVKNDNRNKEEIILNILTKEPQHIDEISSKLNLSVGEVAATLMILEIKRQVGQETGKYFFLLGDTL